MDTKTVTFGHLADLTQRAWRFAQHEWPQLPREPMPVFELKRKSDMKKLGIGYRVAEMRDLAYDEVVFRVIYEVAVQATLLRMNDPRKEDMQRTLDTLLERINEGNRLEAEQATRH